MNVDKIIKQLKDNQHKLADDGYSIFLYVHSEKNKHNQLQCLGDMAHLLVGVMKTLQQIKTSCIAAGMKEAEFEEVCKEAFIIVEERKSHE